MDFAEVRSSFTNDEYLHEYLLQNSVNPCTSGVPNIDYLNRFLAYQVVNYIRQILNLALILQIYQIFV